MKVELVRIGNSRGIRIPKAIIEQCGFGDTVELHVQDHCVVIAADCAPRHGWEKAFSAAGRSDADELVLEAARNQFDEEEWRW